MLARFDEALGRVQERADAAHLLDAGRTFWVVSSLRGSVKVAVDRSTQVHVTASVRLRFLLRSRVRWFVDEALMFFTPGSGLHVDYVPLDVAKTGEAEQSERGWRGKLGITISEQPAGVSDPVRSTARDTRGPLRCDDGDGQERHLAHPHRTRTTANIFVHWWVQQPVVSASAHGARYRTAARVWVRVGEVSLRQ